MKHCTVCYRQARGFGVFDSRYRYNDVERFRNIKAFCSKDCVDIFNHYLKTPEGTMVDLTAYEQQAMNEVLKPLGQYVAQVGMTKLLADYSLIEIQTLVEIVVTKYQEAMQRTENYTENQELPF